MRLTRPTRGMMLAVNAAIDGNTQTVTDLVTEHGLDRKELKERLALRDGQKYEMTRRTGGKGRVAAFEILHNTPAVANLIRDKKTNRITSVIQTSAKGGMILLDDYLFALYKKEIITAEMCMQRAMDFGFMEQKMLTDVDDDNDEDEDENGGISDEY